MTYQDMQKTTGAPRPLVIKAKRAIIKGRHTATAEDIRKMIDYIERHKDEENTTSKG